MPSFNRITLIGNLTRDPQLKQLPSNTAVCEFGLAINRRYRTQAGEDREEVCFVDCAAFGKTGEVIQQYCQKGKALLIEGRLKYDQWEDKQGGGKRSKLSIVVENFQFLGDRAAGDEDVDQRPQPGRRPATARGAKSMPTDRDTFKEDDIPF